MKKLLLILALTVLFLLGMAGTTLAGTAYLDYLMGTWEAMGDDSDATALIIGVTAPLESFLVGGEYAAITWEAPSGETGTADVTSLELRGGYLVTNDDDLKFSVGLGYFSQDYETDIAFSGFALALDLIAGSETFLFEGTVGYSLNGQVDFMGTDYDAVITFYRLRFSYLFNESFGLTLGYRSWTDSIDESGAPEFITSGLSLGATYKF